MSPELTDIDLARWQRAEVLFGRARTMPTHERATLLEQVRATDEELAALVATLLEHDAGALADLDEPAAAIGLKVSSTDPVAGGAFGEYQLLEPIGQGRSGVVYRARHRLGTQDVAVKVLAITLFPGQSARRFSNEVRALRRLQHPNIAAMLEAGTVAEPGGVQRPFFAMQLVRGQRITDHCAGAACSMEQRVRLLLQLCDAVGHAHRHAILHRDLSPANVLVEQGEHGEPCVRVIDFGLARFLDGHETGTHHGLAMGTPGFMSPEQQRGELAAVDTRTDIYSVAALLKVLVEPMQEPRAPLEDLRAIAQMATAAAPSARYQTIDAMADDLRCVLRGQPVRARPRTATYVLARYVRRHPARAATMAAALLLASLGTAAAASAWRQTANSQQRLIDAGLMLMRDVNTLYGNRVGHFDFECGLLETLLPQWEALRAQRPSDPQVQAGMAVLLGRLGDCSSQQLDHAQALEHWRRVEALRAQIAQASPDDADKLAEWSTAVVRVGDEAAQLGDLRTRDRQYEAALEMATRGLVRWPESVRMVSDLASCHERLGAVALASGDRDAALRHADSQLAFAQQVLALEGPTRRALWDLASAHGTRGVVFDRLMQTDAAAGERAEAVSMLTDLAQRLPNDREVQVRLSSALVALGRHAESSDEPAIAAVLTPAQGSIDRVSTGDPMIGQLLPYRAGVAALRARLLATQGRLDEALQVLDAAEPEITSLTGPAAQMHDVRSAFRLLVTMRAQLCADAGRDAEAVACLQTAAEWLDRTGTNAAAIDDDMFEVVLALANLAAHDCEDPWLARAVRLSERAPRPWHDDLQLLRVLRRVGCQMQGDRLFARLGREIPPNCVEARTNLTKWNSSKPNETPDAPATRP